MNFYHISILTAQIHFMCCVDVLWVVRYKVVVFKSVCYSSFHELFGNFVQFLANYLKIPEPIDQRSVIFCLDSPYRAYSVP